MKKLMEPGIGEKITKDGSCNVYVAEMGNQVIRKITPAAVVTTLAGTMK